MRKFVFILAVLVILSVLAKSAYHYARPDLPAKRILVDREGREYDVTIVGKWEDTLTVEPDAAPDAPFDLSIKSLSLNDRAYVSLLPQKEPSPIRLPLTRTITSPDGKQMKVVIVGRGKDHVTIKRDSDQVQFDIPFEKLGVGDQNFLSRIPLESSAASGNSPPPESSYVANRRKRIEELKEREALFKKEISSGALSQLIHQNRVEQLASTQKEIKSLEVAIETYLYRNQGK